MSLPVSDWLPHGLAGYFWASGKYATQLEELIKQWSLPHFSFGREDRGGGVRKLVDQVPQGG